MSDGYFHPSHHNAPLVGPEGENFLKFCMLQIAGKRISHCNLRHLDSHLWKLNRRMRNVFQMRKT